ncbi:hypothetical protein KBJ94_29590 [Pseudomonas sp. ITA]|uniref:hypothetical protein n=1 Tax=Pseudomonas sp. ITA TaxID=2825841 RepID=UPI00249837A6|nr:hypothetical protein [Pseudomonas sp. ITA]MDI2146205.1 hypothetical protein [Pseudomonas sp. ITA]
MSSKKNGVGTDHEVPDGKSFTCSLLRPRFFCSGVWIAIKRYAPLVNGTIWRTSGLGVRRSFIAEQSPSTTSDLTFAGALSHVRPLCLSLFWVPSQKDQANVHR